MRNVPDLIQVTVVIPYHIPRRRGANAITKFDTVTHIRMNEHDRNIIKRAAQHLDVDFTAFIRQIALNASVKVIEHYEGERIILNTEG